MVEIVGDRTLRDLVSLRQVRRKRNYARNGTVVEVSVDDVEVMVGAQVAERFAELELELRDGQEVDLEPLADMLGEIEELVAVDSSKFERALEVVRREPREPEADDADGPAENGAALSVVEPAPSHGRSGAQRRKRRKAALTAPVELVAIPIEPDAGDEASVEAAAPATADGGSRPRPRRRGSSSRSRPACSPTTTSPRPGARSCGSTSPGWSRARRGPARARTPRSSTRCASRRGGSGRRGACSATPSTPSAPPAIDAACAWSPPTSARSATSTS